MRAPEAEGPRPTGSICLSEQESGLSKGKQMQERTFCVVPLMSSSRTGGTHLWGQKSGRAGHIPCPDLGGGHTEVHRYAVIHGAAHLRHAGFTLQSCSPLHVST